MSSAASATESLPSPEATCIPAPLSLPPERDFDSYEELLQFAQAHAKSALYALVIGKSERRKGRMIRILVCQRGGHSSKKSTYRPGISEDLRSRNRSTLKTGCLFSIKARERKTGTWSLSYRENEGFSTHNHPAAETSSAFASHRQLTDSQLQIVHANHLARIAPIRTVIALRQQDSTLEIIPRDIYNINAELGRTKRQGRSPPEALIIELELQKAKGEIVFTYEKDSQGHINFLFLAAVKSVKYFNKNPEIVLLDCTYKTNRFGMPLLHIMGVDGLNQTFTIAVCFLDQETGEFYDKAILQLRHLLQPGVWPSIFATDSEVALIGALERHFPPIRTKIILCFWHICKNVALHCKARFETADRWEDFIKGFRDVVQAKTEEDFDDILEEWKVEFH